jgi:hypothetical protein
VRVERSHRSNSLPTVNAGFVLTHRRYRVISTPALPLWACQDAALRWPCDLASCRQREDTSGRECPPHDRRQPFPHPMSPPEQRDDPAYENDDAKTKLNRTRTPEASATRSAELRASASFPCFGVFIPSCFSEPVPDECLSRQESRSPLTASLSTRIGSPGCAQLEHSPPFSHSRT